MRGGIQGEGEVMEERVEVVLTRKQAEILFLASNRALASKRDRDTLREAQAALRAALQEQS